MCAEHKKKKIVDMMNMKRFFCLLIVGCGLTGMTCQAQDRVDVTLQKAIDIALAENPTIRVADKEIELKNVSNEMAWHELLPTINATGSLQHTLMAAKMNFNGQTVTLGRDNTNTAALVGTLQLPVFAPAVYQNMKLTKQDIELAKEKARGSRLDLVHEVTKAYYQLLLACDSRDVMAEALKVSEEALRVVSARYKVGSVSEYDEITAEVQMRSMKSNLVSAETGVTLAELRLKVLMGITTSVTLVPQEKLNDFERELSLANTIPSGSLLANNSSMRQLEMNRGLLERTLKIQKTSLLPTVAFTLTGQYQAMYQEGWNIFNYSPWPSSASFTLSVSVPVFNLNNWTRLKSTRLQLSQLEDTRLNTERQLNMAVQSYQKNMESTLVAIESDRQAVEKAEKAVNISQKKYEVGRGTVLDMNQSQLALTQAKLTYDQAVYDFIVNRADMEYTLGELPLAR